MSNKLRIEQFVTVVKAIRNEYYARHFPSLEVEDIRIKWGRKYAKLVVVTPEGRDGSVYCFVNIENGDILKAASWNAPAKHARGNVNSDDLGASAVGPYGANYLR